MAQRHLNSTLLRTWIKWNFFKDLFRNCNYCDFHFPFYIIVGNSSGEKRPLFFARYKRSRKNCVQVAINVATSTAVLIKQTYFSCYTFEMSRESNMFQPHRCIKNKTHQHFCPNAITFKFIPPNMRFYGISFAFTENSILTTIWCDHTIQIAFYATQFSLMYKEKKHSHVLI